MPIARFQMDDGRVARFEVPEGTSPEQAQSMMMEHFTPAQPMQQSAPLTKTERFLKGVTDPIEGGAQLLTKILPQSIVNAGDSMQNWIADKTGLMNRLPAGGSDELFRKNEADYEARRKASGETGIDTARLAGNVLSPANLLLAAKLPTAAAGAGLAAKSAYGALGGGLSSITSPVTEGDYWSEKAKQLGAGLALGSAVPAVIGAGARVISPNASVNQNLNLLKSEGVKPTIGQTLGGVANRMEEAAMSLPFVGDSISMARNRAKEQFNQAAINRAMSPIGGKVEGVGAGAVKEAGDAIGSAIDKAERSLGGFKIDQQATNDLESLKNLAATGLQGRERNTVEKYFKDYLNRPALTAESFTELNSKLGSDIAKFKSGDAYQQKVGDALSEVKQIITDNAMRSNPVAADDLRKAREAYANLVRLEGASVAAKGTEGVFTPGQLLTAVRGADKSVRDRSTARGTALMQDLASAGQSVLGNKLPNSGTADRMIYGGGLLGIGAGGMAFPISTAALTASGMAAYTPPVQSFLRGLASYRGSSPEQAKAIADALRNRSLMIAPVAGQMGAELLK